MNIKASPGWLALQAAAIVGSILLAFAMEAWWGAREESDTERALLAALELDIDRLQKILDGRKQYTAAILKSTIKLLRTGTEAKSNELTDKQIDLLIGDLFWYHPEESLQSGPLVALMDGGEMRHISAANLRLSLSNLYAALPYARGLYGNDENFHHETFLPFMIEHANMPQLTQSMSRPGDPDFDYGYPKLVMNDTTSHRNLLADPRFQNMLIGKLDRLLDIQKFAYPPLERELANAAQMIAEELLD